MELFIRVDVKFRVLFKDLAKFNETYRISLGIGGLAFEKSYIQPPENAHKVLDRNGVKLRIWQ